jgi:hypothetical protein
VRWKEQSGLKNEMRISIQNVEVKKEPINNRKKRRTHTVEAREDLERKQKLR